MLSLTVCQTRTYGANCSEICSDHCSGVEKACSPFDGSCDEGCTIGFQSPLCDEGMSFNFDLNTGVYTVDLDYNNISCNETLSVAKSFSSLNNCTRTSAVAKAY